jgi:hypothetical protein
MHPVFGDMMRGAFGPSSRGEQHKAQPQTQAGVAPLELGMGVHERILQSGLLSKTASYRVIVTGHVGVAEIDRLLRRLRWTRKSLPIPIQNTRLLMTTF